MHLGHGRNISLGDTIARLLKKAGGIVETRFYIDDVGRQTAILVYGLTKLGGPEKWMELMGNLKTDHWIGMVYAITNTVLELHKTKKLVEKSKDNERTRYIEKQDSLIADAARLREKAPSIFDVLAEKIMSDEEPEITISLIMHSYERGEDEYKEFVRKAVALSINGFKKTLDNLNVSFDKWDWESNVVWNSYVKKIMDMARNLQLTTRYKDTIAIDLAFYAENQSIRKRLRIPGGLDIPPLILMRSDGTTLYTTRDVGYTIYKFVDFDADYVINVVGKEQTLPQAQLRLALYALGYRDYAERLIHYSYEMVSLPGRKMSSRKGEFVSLDDVLNIMKEKALDEIERRGFVSSETDKKSVSKMIGSGSLRYFLVSVSAMKPMSIKYNEIIDFEKNTAPYIQYTHARATGILRKINEINLPRSYKWVNENSVRYLLVRELSKYPYILGISVMFLQPELIVSYLGTLSQLFNRWYQFDGVLSDPVSDRKRFKILLVYTTKNIISDALDILGVGAPEKM